MSHDRKMGHVQSLKVYLSVLGALFVLTVTTVLVSIPDMGLWNDVVALLVATCKASLVILFFMHGRFESRLTWAFIYYPLIVVGLLFAGVFLDYTNRVSSMQDAMAPVSAIGAHGGDHGEDAGDHGEDAGDHGTDAKDADHAEEADGHDGDAKEEEHKEDGQEHDDDTGHN